LGGRGSCRGERGAREEDAQKERGDREVGDRGQGGPAGVREWGGRAWGVCVCELQGGCWVGTGGQGEGAER
jgi:hypothetical protein